MIAPTLPISVPTTSEVKAAIPTHCWDRHLGRSLVHAALSVTLTLATGLLAIAFLPFTWAWAPVWVLYAVVNGSFAIGVWVIAHECGHRAFCNGTRLQDTIGFILHSALLVPYFSWQRSHAVHHAKTNHLAEGETHVPKATGTRSGKRAVAARARLGATANGVVELGSKLLIGWPAYLVAGTTGGPTRGTTNHFWPYRPFSDALFPNRWKAKVLASAVGVGTTVALLVWWASTTASMGLVLAAYGGPYLVCNMWLVTYTWLQHTNHDVPHYDEDWSFVRGAFCSVDRPYGRLFDLLHHRIGSTHVAHHIDAKIPHYRAREATDAIADAFPHLYRYDATSVPRALWRVARDCFVVAPSDDGWQFSVAGDPAVEPIDLTTGLPATERLPTPAG